MSGATPRVVILGGGFAGLAAALTLARQRTGADVLLVDRRNYHLFTPLLYQVATGLVDPDHVAQPLRWAVRAGFRYEARTVQAVEFGARRVATAQGPVPYDVLVIALGTVTHDFGLPGVREFALPLKTLPDATRIHNAVLAAFERAALEPDRAARRRLLTFVIVGAGATGVELAGALADFIRLNLRRDYPTVPADEPQVLLLEVAQTVLPGLDPRLAAPALRVLQARGVEVRLGARVAEVLPNGVRLDGGERLDAGTVVWAAGMRPHPLVADLGLPTGRGGRVVVTPALALPDRPEVFVVGDLALVPDPRTGVPLSQDAAVAVREGEAVGRAVAQVVRGQAPSPFRYRHQGVMVSLGRHVAVAEVRGLHFNGFAAWLAWRIIHLSKIMTLRNRLGVVLDWSFAYVYRRNTALLRDGIDE